jgi:hypothetical protein
MGDPRTPLAHPLVASPNAVLSTDKGQKEGADGRNTSEAKLIFDIPGGAQRRDLEEMGRH